MEDRRKHKRYPIRVAAEALTSAGNVSAVVTEISTGGLKLRTSQSITPNTPIDVIIHIGRQITFGGQVVWVIQKFDQKRAYYQCGIETDFVSDQDEEVLYLRRLENLVKEIVARTRVR